MIRITYDFWFPPGGVKLDVTAILVRRKRWRTMPESKDWHWSVATWRGWVLALYIWGTFPRSTMSAPQPVEPTWYDKMLSSSSN